MASNFQCYHFIHYYNIIGEEKLHTLINVHFICKGLKSWLNPRPAMLYFVFNEKTVSVFVVHDPDNDEWVCQIPIFPPFRSLEVRRKSCYLLIW